MDELKRLNFDVTMNERGKEQLQLKIKDKLDNVENFII
jgi:hypothetical protein